MTTEEEPRPLDAVDGDAPESLTRALRALGRQRPSDAFLHAAALRLDARLQPAPRGAFESIKSWGGSSAKLLTGKLVAAALVLGGATIALRSALPATPPGPTAQVAGTAALAATPVHPSEPASEPVPHLVESPPAALPGAEGASVAAPIATPPRQLELPAHAGVGTARSSVSARVRRVRSGPRHAPHAAAPALAVSTPVTPAEARDPSQTATPPGPAPMAATTTGGQAASESLPAREAKREPKQASEVELLLDAKRRAGSDPEGTLRVVAEHARRFPDGTLAPEREVLAIEALRALGRDAEAQQRFARFRARFPSSIHVRALSSQIR